MNVEDSDTFPTLRAKMGDRWYYVTTMTFAEVVRFIQPVDKMHERIELKNWIQRILRPERREEIASYLRKEKQRFFNAIVVGIYGGDPQWFPVDVGESATVQNIKLGEREVTAFGYLRLSGNEDIFAIDGQHRVEGIRASLEEDGSLKDDELVVIFVSHKKTDEGRERTRRLFTTLNKYAKPVSQAELIALNDDDTFAIITRRLIESYVGLGSEFVPLAPTANIPPDNQSCITTIIALYELVKTICIPRGSKERKSLEEGPPNWKRVDDLYCETTLFWDALKATVPAIRRVTHSQARENLASHYRTKDGGNLLFRPAGLQGFARAARVLEDKGLNLQSAVAELAHVPLQLTDKPWVGILWNPATQTMVVKNKRLVANLFLHLVGVGPIPKEYKLLAEYRKAVGDEKARLPKARRKALKGIWAAQ